MKKKIFSIFLFTTIIFLGVFSPLKTNISFIDNNAQTKKAEAVFGVGDLVSDIWTEIESAISSGVDVVVKAYEFAKPALEYAADLFAKQLIHQVILKIQNDLVSWIQNGFDGQPRFMEKPGSVLADAASAATQNVVQSVTGVDLCSTVYSANFKAKLSITANGQTTKTNLWDNGCTFDQLKKNLNTNVDKFKNDFTKGGMQLYASLLDPQNNAYGIEIGIGDAIARKQEAAIAATQVDMQVNSGFLSSEECLAWTVYNSKGTKVGTFSSVEQETNGKKEIYLKIETEENAFKADGAMTQVESAINFSNAKRKEVVGLSKDASAQVLNGNVTVRCNKSNVTTPGTAVGQMATKALGLKQDSIVNANDISGLISVVIDALTDKVMQTGLRKVAGLFNENDLSEAKSNLSKARDNINNLGDWAETTGKAEREKMVSELQKRYEAREELSDTITGIKGELGVYRQTLEDVLTCYASSTTPNTTNADYIWAKNELVKINDQGSDIRSDFNVIEQARDNGVAITRGVGSLWKTDQMIANMSKNGGNLGKPLSLILGSEKGYSDRTERTCSTQICMAEKVNLRCIIMGITTLEGEGDTLVPHYAIEKNDTFLTARLSSGDLGIVNANICKTQTVEDPKTTDPSTGTYGPYKFKDLFGGTNGISLVQLSKFHESINITNISTEIGCGESCSLDTISWWQDETILQILTEYINELIIWFNNKYSQDLVRAEKALRVCKGEKLYNPSLVSPIGGAKNISTGPVLTWEKSSSTNVAYYIIKIGTGISVDQFWNNHVGIGWDKSITNTSFAITEGLIEKYFSTASASDLAKAKSIFTSSGFLQVGKTYWWTVMGVTSKGETGEVGGQVWSFTTKGE